MAGEVSRQVPDKLDLLFNREPAGDRLENRADCDPVFADQTAVVYVGEYTHQKSTTLPVSGGADCANCQSNILAVHSIGHSPMPRNAVTKIFDVEGTLESGGEEAAKRSNEGRENGHDENVQVVGRVRDGRHIPTQLRGTKFNCESDEVV